MTLIISHYLIGGLLVRMLITPVWQLARSDRSCNLPSGDPLQRSTEMPINLHFPCPILGWNDVRMERNDCDLTYFLLLQSTFYQCVMKVF